MRTRIKTSLVLIFLASIFISCKTILNYPLCPRLANTKPSALRNVGQALDSFCKRNNIKITPVTENLAQFSGSRRAMIKLQQTFHILMCDFDQGIDVRDAKGNPIDKGAYESCVANLSNWIKEVQQQNNGNLLSVGVNYCNVCMSSQNCH